MRLSTFISFLAFFIKKASMAGEGSRKFLAFNLFLAICLVSTSVVFGVIFTRHQASAQRDLTEPHPQIITAPIRIPQASSDATLRELAFNQTTFPPDKWLASIHILVDSSSNALTFTRMGIGHNQILGTNLRINPGQSRKFAIPYLLSTPVSEVLDNFVVRTEGSCNFLLVIELKTRIPEI